MSLRYFLQSTILVKCESTLRSLIELQDNESITGITRQRNKQLENAYDSLLIGSGIDKEKPPGEISDKVYYKDIIAN